VTDERELLRRAQAGDRRAFDELVRIFHRAVFSYARRVLGDEERGAEAAQETFVRAWRYRGSFDPAKGSVRAWLFAIAANRIREARRSRRKEPAAIEDPGALAASGEDGLAAFARGALREEVTRALESLPDEFREVLTLKYFETTGRRRQSARPRRSSASNPSFVRSGSNSPVSLRICGVASAAISLPDWVPAWRSSESA